MTITIPEGSAFRFNGGTMSSDLLPCESYKIFFAKAGNIIFPTDWAANKIGETCMRAVCHLDKASNTGTGPKPKTTLLLFQRSAEEMSLLSEPGLAGDQDPAGHGGVLPQDAQLEGPHLPPAPTRRHVSRCPTPSQPGGHQIPRLGHHEIGAAADGLHQQHQPGEAVEQSLGRHRQAREGTNHHLAGSRTTNGPRR
jgi:hypothetical protein